MKKGIWIPCLALSVFLAAPALQAQDHTQKELRRELREMRKELRKTGKISQRDMKRMQKEIQSLHNESRELVWLDAEKIREEAEAQREKAMAMAEKQRYMAREQAERIREESERMRDEHLRAAEEYRDQMLELKENSEVLKWKNPKKGVYFYRGPEDFEFEWRDFDFPEIEVPEFHFPDSLSRQFKYFAPGANVIRDLSFYSESNLNIRKDLENSSDAADYEFIVKEGSEKITISVNGELGSGKIDVTITRPDGTQYQKIQLSPLADVNWKQTIEVDEDQSDSCVGHWKVTVQSKEASGNYALKMAAY